MKFSLLYLNFTLNILFCVNLVLSDVMPVPGDCTKYQLCDYSGCFVFNCGIGTEFNPKVKICDYPLGDRRLCGNRVGLGSLPTFSGVQSPMNYYPEVQNPTNYYPSIQNPTNNYQGTQNPTSNYPGIQNPMNDYIENQASINYYSGY